MAKRNKIKRPQFTQEKTVALQVPQDPKQYIRGEWLVANGLGGYASSTIIGVMTRKYHALLVSALPDTVGRVIMLNHLIEEVIADGTSYLLNCEESSQGNLNVEALSFLKEFYLEDGLPVWIYQVKGFLIEKRIFMAYRQNTVYITYKLLEGPESLKMKLYPCLHFRPHESPVNLPLEDCYSVTINGERFEFSKEGFPSLKLRAFGEKIGKFTIQPQRLKNIFFRMESWRGYESLGDLWNPGFFELTVTKGKEGGLIGSTETWTRMDALPPDFAREAEAVRRKLLIHLANPIDEIAAELCYAADQFIITPKSRMADTVRANACGEEIRTIIAGYHWFTDWGRDTMISLEGLTLCTHRDQEARWILKTFAHYVKNGLIPNMFPEGSNEGLYHTADATLWFFHAIDRYAQLSKDPFILEEMLPTLKDIMEFHIRGTLFGIHMDNRDKLLIQGAENYQLTWMDAKVGNWVVTPRRGKAVEINALWYNALKLMEEWTEGEAKAYYASLSKDVFQSFNERFWIPETNTLYDVVDGEQGNDAAVRPNQLLAISLKYPVLKESYWEPVVQQCKEKLLTPVGLRTLAKDHPDFKANYEGDLRFRDAAYHQGTVWPWLIGPFIDAWVKVYPQDRIGARCFLEAFTTHLGDAGLGTISEIFDAMEPYYPRGCMAQAWSVAEVLRTWIKTAP